MSCRFGKGEVLEIDGCPSFLSLVVFTLKKRPIRILGHCRVFAFASWLDRLTQILEDRSELPSYLIGLCMYCIFNSIVRL